MTDKSEILLTNVRLSFPSLMKPESFRGADGAASKPRYSAAFLIPKSDDATVARIKEALLATAIAKWGPEDGPVELKRLVGNNKLCFADGDNYSYDGYSGHYVVRTAATEERPPEVFDEYAKAIDPGSPLIAKKLYAGCYVNAIVRFWAQGAESGFGKRLNGGLLGVQFAADGDAFGAGPLPAGTFTPTAVKASAFEDADTETKTGAAAPSASDLW